jgi:hypothetical protein
MTGLDVQALPRFGLPRFTAVLTDIASPAAPDAALLYRICVDAGIDPCVALAFFAHESHFGTDPNSVTVRYDLHSWGNVRTPYYVALGSVIATDRGPFARYDSYPISLFDWADRIKFRYGKERGLTTVETIVPVYAPASDHNAPAVYVAAIRSLVAKWSV